jgi:hypothetical protein
MIASDNDWSSPLTIASEEAGHATGLIDWLHRHWKLVQTSGFKVDQDPPEPPANHDDRRGLGRENVQSSFPGGCPGFYGR